MMLRIEILDFADPVSDSNRGHTGELLKRAIVISAPITQPMALQIESQAG